MAGTVANRRIYVTRRLDLNRSERGNKANEIENNSSNFPNLLP
jgi:hypothetical protein